MWIRLKQQHRDISGREGGREGGHVPKISSSIILESSETPERRVGATNFSATFTSPPASIWGGREGGREGGWEGGWDGSMGS